MKRATYRAAMYLRVSTAEQTSTIRAIRRIGGILGDDDLAAECIADLPAEDLP